MKIGWFYFTPGGADGFDIIVRDVGADNGDVLVECSVRGETFEKFMKEVLPEDVDRLPEATSEDWAGEPDPPAVVADDTPATEDVPQDPAPEVPAEDLGLEEVKE